LRVDSWAVRRADYLVVQWAARRVDMWADQMADLLGATMVDQ